MQRFVSQPYMFVVSDEMLRHFGELHGVGHTAIHQSHKAKNAQILFNTGESWEVTEKWFAFYYIEAIFFCLILRIASFMGTVGILKIETLKFQNII